MHNLKKQIAAKKHVKVSAGQQSGFVLVSLLIVATVGILFGFGRLLLYRYQCQLRIQRQHELEKVYAVRSAVRWVELQSDTKLNTIVGAQSFNIDPSSGRSLAVDVRPVSPIYPEIGNADHFRISSASDYTSEKVDLFGEEEMYPKWREKGSKQTPCGVVGPGTNTLGKTGRIVVDMTGTGSWLGDTYGRRYMVNIDGINTAVDTGDGDTLRLYIIPAEIANININNAPAIGLTHIPSGNLGVKSVTAWYRLHGSNVVLNTSVNGFQNINAKGFQLSGNHISLFNAEYRAWAVAVGTYAFTDSFEIPEELIQSFMGSGESPKELKMVLEVEQTGPVQDVADEKLNKFDRLQVLPAYEFEVALTWPDRRNVSHSEVATVLHLLPPTRSTPGKAFTYDTHGVEKRGYE